MITLFEEDIQTAERKSSKGNQLKWLCNHNWYKADYTGYEGLAEYMVSQLLFFSNLDKESFITYDTEQIQYGSTQYLGCMSRDFMPDGWQLITLERLFQNYYGKSLYRSIFLIPKVENRVSFLVEEIKKITGLEDFGKYISQLITIDALFLNEDRHTHNIAVLMDENKKFHYCPIFDNGASLLSDTTMDYPLGGNIYDDIDKVKAKTFSQDFDEQLEAVEKLYGQNLQFWFDGKDIERLLQAECYYSDAVKDRILKILMDRKRKYQYLFVKDENSK